MNKKGRPKKEGMDNVIKVAVNDQTVEMLDSTVQETGKSRSDILRELIPLVSSKDFEGLITNTSMETLQNYSQKCWDILNTEGCVFEVESLSDRMPAFLLKTGFPSMVYVKYPTYKIQIYNGENPVGSTSQEKIKKLLEVLKYRYSLYATKADYLVVGDKMKKMDVCFINEVLCLEVDLDKNIFCKNEIVSILKKNGYSVSVFPAYCIRGMDVELLEGEKYFKVLH